MMDKENNKLEANNLDSFLDENDLSPIPCPNCGGKVEVTNSRDCELLRTYAKCRKRIVMGNISQLHQMHFLVHQKSCYRRIPR